MSNYNSQLQSNNTDLQTVLQTLQNKAAGGDGQATPVISVSSDGLITAIAGNKSSTKQLNIQAAKTIIPSTSAQTAVIKNVYTTGTVTVEAIPSNYVVPSGILNIIQNGTYDVKNYASADIKVIKTSVAPEITVDAFGHITAKAGDMLSTYQLAFQAAKTITPSTTSQVAVSSGYYTGGDITVAGDANLKASNIKSGVSIFGVTGTLDEKQAEWSANEDSIVSGTIGEYTNDRVTQVGDYAFALTNIRSVNFPICKRIQRYAFASCYQLSSVNFPACTAIWSSAFFTCHNSSFTSVSFPACKWIENFAFYDCNNLQIVNLSACTSIAANAFKYCYRLSQFYLTGSSVCTLLDSNAFGNTPYAGYSSYFSGTPYIYVPSSLVDAYKTATNWTYFSSRFVGI